MESEEFSAMEEGDLYGLDMGGKGKNDRKRRFSEQQIKSLETMFEMQTKLEPRKKLQLARELGLQPRQVAIWFQNKRARWKSKQLEREYNALRANYEKLLSSFDALKKEKQILVKQLQKLAELLDKQRDESSNEGDSENGDIKGKEAIRPEQESSDLRVAYQSEEEKKLSNYSTQDEVELIEAPAGATSLTSTEQESCFGYDSFQDQQWWEIWPMTE